jgi:hypothetical protein
MYKAVFRLDLHSFYSQAFSKTTVDALSKKKHQFLVSQISMNENSAMLLLLKTTTSCVEKKFTNTTTTTTRTSNDESQETGHEITAICSLVLKSTFSVFFLRLQSDKAARDGPPVDADQSSWQTSRTACQWSTHLRSYNNESQYMKTTRMCMITITVTVRMRILYLKLH